MVSKPKTADGYVRVSRRAGREGESFISPEVQRKKIADWAKLHEVEIVHWWEELDQSGAKLERPMFQQALARCEACETGGIVVARLDRFARSAVDALSSIRRLNESRRSTRLGRGQLRWLNPDGALRDWDPDPDRRA
jgi:DNA invertase Pin-like site-specific DNA recombinase